MLWCVVVSAEEEKKEEEEVDQTKLALSRPNKAAVNLKRSYFMSLYNMSELILFITRISIRELREWTKGGALFMDSLENNEVEIYWFHGKI